MPELQLDWVKIVDVYYLPTFWPVSFFFWISLYLFINIACDDTLWKRVNLGGKSVPCGVIGQLFARGLRYLRLSNATLSSPLMRNKYGYTYNVIHPNKLVRILKNLLKTCLVSLK